MSTWWSGTWLVVTRTTKEAVASKSWRITTLVMLLLGLAAVALPRIIGDDATTYRLATVGETPPGVAAMLEAAGRALDHEHPRPLALASDPARASVLPVRQLAPSCTACRSLESIRLWSSQALATKLSCSLAA